MERGTVTHPRIVKRPKVHSYADYRAFLKDFFVYKRTARPSFSVRRFAELAGFKSPQVLDSVLEGKRPLAHENVNGLVRAMGLVGAERSYFVALANKSSARKPEEVEAANLELLRAGKKLVGRQLPSAQSQVIASWHHFAVRELVVLKDFDEKPEWISKRLRGLITPRQAEESIALLVEAGLLVRDEAGCLRQADAHISTGHDDFHFVRVLQYHMDHFRIWLEVLGGLDKEERELGLDTIPISSDKIPEFKRRIRAFRGEIVEWLSSETQPDRVVQLGTYLVPISH